MSDNPVARQLRNMADLIDQGVYQAAGGMLVFAKSGDATVLLTLGDYGPVLPKLLGAVADLEKAAGQ